MRWIKVGLVALILALGVAGSNSALGQYFFGGPSSGAAGNLEQDGIAPEISAELETADPPGELVRSTQPQFNWNRSSNAAMGDLMVQRRTSFEERVVDGESQCFLVLALQYERDAPLDFQLREMFQNSAPVIPLTYEYNVLSANTDNALPAGKPGVPTNVIGQTLYFQLHKQLCGRLLLGAGFPNMPVLTSGDFEILLYLANSRFTE